MSDKKNKVVSWADQAIIPSGKPSQPEKMKPSQPKKMCSSCGQIKPQKEFSNRQNLLGNGKCKGCAKEFHKEFLAGHKEAKKEKDNAKALAKAHAQAKAQAQAQAKAQAHTNRDGNSNLNNMDLERIISTVIGVLSLNNTKSNQTHIDNEKHHTRNHYVKHQRHNYCGKTRNHQGTYRNHNNHDNLDDSPYQCGPRSNIPSKPQHYHRGKNHNKGYPPKSRVSYGTSEHQYPHPKYGY